jgi:hypothetical protein
MSFASDAGLDPKGNGNFASEATFLLSNNTGNPRAFWLNALENVKEFIKQPNAAFIGLQEINKTDEQSSTGSNAIKKAIRDIKPNFEVITDEIVVIPNSETPNGKIKPGVKPAVTIAWDTSKLGKLHANHIVDLSYTPEEKPEYMKNYNPEKPGEKLPPQKGRPMMMVYTENGYLLITIHAPNYNDTYEGNFDDLRKNIKSNITQFLEKEGITKLNYKKVFIVGDFNDRYDALQTIDIPGGKLTYKGTSPRSCCHNWDSSCTETRFQSKTNLKDRENRTDIGTCDAERRVLAGPGPRELMGVEGNIDNYRYHSDKVFGAEPAGNIRMFPQEKPTGPSNASDHEMVVAEFTVPTNNANSTSGGYSRKYRNKSRKTRKVNRKLHKKINKKHSRKLRK